MERGSTTESVHDRALDYLVRLQQLTAALASPTDPVGVASTVIQGLVDASGAQVGAVYALAPDQGHLEMVAWGGNRAGLEHPRRRLSAGSRAPLGRAVRSGEPIWIESQQEHPDALTAGSSAMAAFPLCFDGQVIGALSLSFAGPRIFHEEDRAFLSAVADLCANALHRAALYQEAEAQRQRFEDLLMHARAGIIITRGPDHRLEFCNQEFRRRLAGREMVGKTLREALPDLAGQGFFEAVDGVYVSGEAFEGRELPAAMDWDGSGRQSVRYFHVLIQPVRDRRGVVDGTMILILDFTARVRAVAETERLAAEQAATLQHLAEGLLLIDRSGTVTYMNDAARAMLGRDVVGTHVESARTSEYIKAADGTPYSPATTGVNRALHAGEITRNINLKVARGGEELMVQSTISPVINAAGERLGAVVLMRDVTRERQIEQQKDDFLAAAAHDLKTPLTIIHGLVQLLERRAIRGDIEPEGMTQQLDRILGTTSKMAGMINALLDLTRLQLDQPLQLDRQTFDLVQLCRQVAEDHQANERRHRIVVEAAEEQVIGQWDQVRVERTLVNLVTNAIRYSPDGGDVTLTVGSQDGEARVGVRDAGMGIPAADLPRIFDRFYRGSNAQRRIDGAGIGLASVKQIVEQHGGTITVESTEGKGATFTLHLPMVPVPTPNGS